MAWRSNPDSRAPARSLAAVLVLCAAFVVCSARPALAAAPNAINQPRLDSTVRYLQDVQNPDGGFAGKPGGESDPDFSAWVALALAAAGINPQDQAQPGGVDVYTYLTEHASKLKLTTDFERELLVVDASGTQPHDFGGVDLVTEILRRRLSGADGEGAFTHEAGDQVPGVNDTIFAILALSPVNEPAVRAAVQAATSWLIDVQNAEGGWPSTTVCPTHATPPASKCENNVDTTGAAIQALNAAGRHETQAQDKAIAYLHRAQDANGGFPQEVGEAEPNVASTAWAVQGIWSAGEDPETWVKDSNEATDEPLGYMASLQQPDGHIRYEASKEENGVWMTAQVAPAFAGQYFPYPPVPRAIPSPPTPPGSPGVIAGGGGNGAALFSRPQPQSQGKAPGGVRLLSSTRKHSARNRRNPGRRPKTPTPTIATEVLEPSGNPPRSGSASASAGTGAASTGKGSSTGTGSNPEGAGSASAGAGSGGPVTGRALPATAGGPEVNGVLIGALASPRDQVALEPGAPGLESAGAGGNQTPWLAIAVGAAIALLIFAGSQLERRRPQVIL